MTATIPVFFSVNNRYAAGLSVAIASLIDHTTATNQYDLIVLYQELSEENRVKLAKLATDNVQIHFVALDTKFGERFDNDQNKLRADYVTLTIYYRLFIADLFPEYDKAIYLDADVLVLDDVADMYNIDLSGSLVGATNDRFIATDPVMSQYADKVVGIDHNLYINSGVLLMDLKQFRDTHFTDRFLALLTKYHFTLIAPDQDYLNALAQGHIYQLPMDWNVQTAVMPAAFKPARLVHYNLFEKPWQYSDVPFSDVFWEEAAHSPYLDVLQAEQKATTAAAIARDDEKATLLVGTAKNLLESATTLKSVLAPVSVSDD